MTWPIWAKSQAEQDREARALAALEDATYDEGWGWHEAVEAAECDRLENAATQSLYRED